MRGRMRSSQRTDRDALAADCRGPRSPAGKSKLPMPGHAGRQHRRPYRPRVRPAERTPIVPRNDRPRRPRRSCRLCDGRPRHVGKPAFTSSIARRPATMPSSDGPGRPKRALLVELRRHGGASMVGHAPAAEPLEFGLRLLALLEEQVPIARLEFVYGDRVIAVVRRADHRGE